MLKLRALGLNEAHLWPGSGFTAWIYAPACSATAPAALERLALGPDLSLR